MKISSLSLPGKIPAGDLFRFSDKVVELDQTNS